MGCFDSGFVQGLQFGKSFLAYMAAVAPFFAQVVQLAVDVFPVGAGGVGASPSVDFFNHHQALGFVCAFFGFDFLKPSFD